MYRKLSVLEIAQLTAQGCTADSWDNVEVKEGFIPKSVHYAHFTGKIKLGVFAAHYELPGGMIVPSGISHAVIHNCEIGDDVRLFHIHNYIANYRIGRGTCIENINAIVMDGKGSFGNGVRVAVMNEGGGREVPIYDHLSAHLAYILTLYRHRPKMLEKVYAMIDRYTEEQTTDMGYIGEDVRILNCGSIKNTRIGDCAHISGASVLKNGSINSNRFAPVKIGSGVKCNDFIISSGVEVTDSTLLSNCFVGQGCIFGKHYSALDSLFFSNCQGMHGEATAIFAGPYTVTHHKSTLLIAGMFSFLNAGSGSNQSNHMYKLGPIHQGVAERGAKTTSDSYILWPAKIGAFTLVMGRHTKHSDTSELPFSYLIENATESYLVPGVNIRSVGTIRDAQKWPKRDNRKDPQKIDQINFNLLSPYTIQKMWHGREILKELQDISGLTTEEYCFHNCRIRNSSLRNGLKHYHTGIIKFLGNSLISRIQKSTFTTMDELRQALQPAIETGLGEWVDCGSLITPKSEITRLLDDIEQGNITDLKAIQTRFEQMHQNYYTYEWTWSAQHLEQYWGVKIAEVSKEQLIDTIKEWKEAVVNLDWEIYDDAKKEFNLNAQTGFGIDGDQEQRLKDFENVRGTFENNSTVKEILSHIERKSRLAEEVLATINNLGEK